MGTGGDSYVICPKGLEAGALKDAAYGTGPYVIDSADRSAGITLKLRSDWAWGPGWCSSSRARSRSRWG